MKRLALAVLAAGCVDTEPTFDGEQLASSDQAIIGGTRSVGVSATVLLAGYPPDRSVLHTCTAVVVSPTVLLTSAHCIDAPNHPSYLFGVFIGDDASPYPNLAALEPELRAVKSVHPHPQYSTQLPFFADIGVVVAAAPLPVMPLPMQRDPINTSIIGKPAQIVGYGQTVYNQANQTRHEAMTTVGAIENDTLVVGDNQKRACLGDSGGPAIVDGKVAGIDSYGPVGCGAPAHYRRVDAFMPFIAQYVPAPDPGGTDETEPTPGSTDDLADTDGGGCAAAGAGATGPVAALLACAFGPLRRRRRRARM